ncbi:MAG: N,N'-diacetylchitobiose phosphorylase [Firmicutes bacterium ADurb.Bin193]|nr:MAG: N,N'-diacetylchitobiose phosphorylase [Firmicutes bacterium ADurb.Bin193]
MINSIGIFFCAVFIILIYMLFRVETGKRGKFDVRGATLDYDALIWHAGQLARYHELSTGKGSMDYLLGRMTENYRYISATYRRLGDIVSSGHRITGADEWLLDNFYIIEEQTKDLLQNIQKKYFKRLPLIKEGQYSGYPRIFAIALEFVSHTDSTVTQQSIIDFINEYQKTTYLSDMEIWSLSSMLKIALIENIRHLCVQINKTHTQYSQARSAVSEVLEKKSGYETTLGPVFKGMITENTSLIENLLYLLKKHGKEGGRGLRFIDARLHKLNTSSESIIAIEHQKQTSRQVSMGNAITSLRFILALDYTKIFESLSQVERILNNDISGIYPKMDKKTKNYYRRNVERIAKRYDITEVEVALTAVELANENNCHIGRYLIETDLGADNTRIKKIQQAVYWAGVLSVTLFLSGLLYAYCDDSVDNAVLPMLVFLISLIPASDIAINLCKYIASHFIKTSTIPRLEFTEGAPPECATLVVISALLPNAEQAQKLANRLEIYYLANKQDNIRFGLLGDFADGKHEHTERDEEIIKAADEVIQRLNEKYGQKFYLFHRKRVYNEKNKNYMGWERKRGAIVELCRFLRGEKNTTFTKITGDIPPLFETKYVITLDADTKLPRDSAKELIGAMAHPLNKPEIKNGCVVKGYGIMQPRINIDTESANTSFFSRVLAGQGGIDVYSGAVSDIYQDLFGEGIFTGKGIFDVDCFYEILSDTIPENKVLSHDLLEGSYLRCALISDVELTDGFPWKYSSYSARMHRWIRGDWQLIPWLTGSVKNPLSAVSKWKMFDNIRRSLVPVFLTILIFLAFNLLPGSSFVWAGFTLLTICFSLLISTVDWAFNEGYRYIGQRCHATIIYGLKGVIYEAAFLFILLFHYACITADAAIRTVYRMTVSKKKLLEWVTAADADKRPDNGIKGYYRKMMSSCVLAVLFFLFSTKYIAFSALLTAVWLCSPAIMYLASRTDESKKHIIKEEDKAFLIETARKTWQYFEDFTTVSDNYLAPDNYQEDPPNGAAHRTSPTNIGLHLCAIVCARDMGFIDSAKAVDMLEKVTGTIERLDKWNGHLYNWYNTRTLEVMRPRYISTVDSGNLCGYCLAVIAALNEIADNEPGLKERTDRVAGFLKNLYDNTNFRLLYDDTRHLFTIGYNAEEEHLTKSYYDLLSSEARMASFIAIAKGEVPKKHWFTLGRTLVSRDGYKGLVSWTGTMFEYLMPLILMKNIKNTLIDETYHFVIHCQKKYGRARNVPWGTSESGFNAFDIDLNYQYKAFGVPDLGLKRGLMSDMVVAPYASIMALMVDFDSAIENIRQLESIGILGKYGLYEAIDYTPERILPHQKYSVIKSYMVHHLGMSLLSINNVLNDNILQKRFHRDVTIQATEEILGERVPVNVIISKENHEKIKPLKPIVTEEGMCVREINSVNVNGPKVHILSNGRMSCVISDSGLGYVSVGNVAITRFRGDLQNGAYGNFVYIKDITRGGMWSNFVAPLFENHDKYRVVFSGHKAEFYRSYEGIDTSTEIIVSPEDNAEIRKLTIANHTDEDLLLEITNYQEITLTAHSEDYAHPAFSNLFIRTEYDEGLDCIIAGRRPRGEEAKAVYALQTICVNGDKQGRTEFETDRAKFTGRKNTLQNPVVMSEGAEMSRTAGAVLDPIMSQRFKLKIESGSVSSFAVITAYGETREEVIELAHKYRNASNIERAFDMALSRSKVENKYLGISAADEKAAYEILANTIYILPYRRRLSEYISKNTLGQQSLWPFGISGDNPIVVLCAYSVDELDILKSLLEIHELWRIKGQIIDLVIISEDEGSYNQPLITAIRDIVSVSHVRELVNTGGGIFMVNGSTVSPEVKTLLLASARVVLYSNKGDIISQLETEHEENHIPYISFAKEDYPTEEPTLGEVEFYNGMGGFTGGEYAMKISNSASTPLPWCNVAANANFGFLVTESGGGFCWHHNSRENKLTPWTNDPVSDPLHEVIYIRDDECGGIWTPFSGSIITRHGKGYSSFEGINCGIRSLLTVFTPPDAPTKISILELNNKTDKRRKITLTYYVNPIIGVGEREAKPFIKTEKRGGFITAQNSYNTDYPDQTVYVSSSEEITSFTCDKRELFGTSRFMQTPNGLLRCFLSNTEGSGLDSCIAFQNTVILEAGETRQIVFSMSVSDDTYTPEKAHAFLEMTKQMWREKTGRLVIKTPERSMDIMINSWLLYQTLSCRIYARAAFYQCGGAYGFRDQLQDVLALLMHDPQLAREHIIRCASHQFPEGDVQHWWHEVKTEFRGVRTRFSDDLLWLPYAVSEYIRISGDSSILDEEAPYIQSDPLCEGEDEKYCPAVITEQKGTIREHCERAIARAMQFGERGLPLMGSGDWNDGMNLVGNDGRGESVWLGWFLYDVLGRFGYPNDELKENLQKAWDGAWYCRAYTDEGVPLGSGQNTECKIDAIAQAWSVISGAGREDYQSQSMASVMKYLVNREEGIIKLLTPPFDDGEINPGYIKGYVPGVRENGGQYTHAAAWVILAFAKLGMGDTAAELYSLINPINHSRTPIEVSKYKAEPYVIAADVYSAGANTGRGGWTWYTGAAGWIYRVGVEWILGIRKEGESLIVDPCIPRGWKEFSFEYRYGNTNYSVSVKNPDGLSKSAKPTVIPLADDGQNHNIEIIMSDNMDYSPEL